jgi:hypothetical protein
MYAPQARGAAAGRWPGDVPPARGLRPTSGLSLQAGGPDRGGSGSCPALRTDASDLLVIDASRVSTAGGARTGPDGPTVTASPVSAGHVTLPLGPQLWSWLSEVRRGDVLPALSALYVLLGAQRKQPTHVPSPVG